MSNPGIVVKLCHSDSGYHTRRVRFRNKQQQKLKLRPVPIKRATLKQQDFETFFNLLESVVFL